MSPRIYIDLDGTLADFDRHHEVIFGFRSDKLLDNVDWKKVRNCPNFYRDIPPMVDMLELWSFVLPYDPVILTGIPSLVTEAATNKREWVDKNLGRDVSMIACASKEKCKVCRPGDILIDDWEKYRDLWVAAGGRWITHVSAAQSVEKLKEVLNGGTEKT